MKVDYFKSKSSMYLFALLETTGKIQLDLLGITYNHYNNENLANNWYKNIKREIINTEFINLDEAIKNLDKLYSGMIG